MNAIVSGDIVATSFKLGNDGHALSAADISDFDTAVTNVTGNSFSINGISSNYNWNGNTYTVALTSTDSLLIGANNTNGGGIIITKNANTAAVVIDKTGINFEVDTNTFIHMSSTGV